MYCTPAHLADAKLARELAQVATPERERIVDDALMEATLRGIDRSGFDPADVVVADAALLHVERALNDADGVINGYLRLRKPTPYVVPLDPVPSVVTVWARAIARYLLHKDRVHTQEASDPVVRDYRDAIRFLELTRDGKFSLGVDDPLPPAGAGMPQFVGEPREFTMHSLRDYGT